MASILSRYRPRGGSLVLAVAFRLLSLPVLAAVAVAFATSSRAAGAITFCWLLGVELVVRRWRWAWQRLDRLPATDQPPANQADAHRLTRHYGAGTVVLGLALALWQVVAGEGIESFPRIGAIVLVIGSAVAGHWGFERLVRAGNPRLRTKLGDDDALDVGEMGLLVMLLPKRWWRGGATFVAFGIVVMLGGMFGLGVVAGAVDALWTDPTFIFFFMPLGVTLVAVSACVTSMIEATNATSFIEACGDDRPAGSPSCEPTSA